MSIFKKFQNLFMDDVEETEEIEIEEKTESPKLPTIMQNEINKKVSIQEKPEQEKPEETIVSDNEATRTNMKFNFPIEFNEKDWTSIKRKKSLYNTPNKTRSENTSINSGFKNTLKKEEPKPQPKFRCSPIISPVYGILDKNYKKEDVQAKDIEGYEIPRANVKVDFESIRKKAFGTLTDDLKDNMMCEGCELLKKEISKEESNFEYDNLLDNIVDNSKTMETAEENYADFGIIYDHKTETKEMIPNKIEVEVEDERNNIDSDTIKITNHNDEEILAEKIEVKEPIEESRIETRTSRIEQMDYHDITEEILDNSKENTNKLELTDDLYDLIDSMYEER